jgi:hypothetical protein
MATPLPDTPTAPPAVRLLLLLLLPLIALALYLDGQRFDPDQVQLKPRQAVPAAELFPASLVGLGPSGPVRHYGRDNLYEIGRAHV